MKYGTDTGMELTALIPLSLQNNVLSFLSKSESMVLLWTILFTQAKVFVPHGMVGRAGGRESPDHCHAWAVIAIPLTDYGGKEGRYGVNLPTIL